MTTSPLYPKLKSSLLLEKPFQHTRSFYLLDKELRERLKESEHKLGLSMPLEEAKDRAVQLQSEVTTLERRLILASGIEGMDGFRQRWSLHGRLEDIKKRLESLNRGIENRKRVKEEPQQVSTAIKTPKRWFFW